MRLFNFEEMSVLFKYSNGYK